MLTWAMRWAPGTMHEAVTGRAPSEKALRILMTVGLALILTVMLFALSNDLFCP